jgi:cytochrome c oxidase subunit II
MKLKIIATILLVMGAVLLVGCSSNNANTTEDLVTPTGEVKTIKMVAKQWAFVPENIEVNLGETVQLIIESVDVDHGINLPSFGVSEYLQAGKTVQIEFVADKKGEFGFSCSVMCGSGHRGMRGNLIVK